MVVPLGPGKFYGSSLPRPRIYTDTKFNTERIDPPVSVMDPFLSWANEAHWSMGGLSFKRLRLQGRIEGSVSKLRKQQEKTQKLREEQISRSPPVVFGDGKKKRPSSALPPSPAAPVAVKRRRYVALSDEEEEASEKEEVRVSYRRKLEDDFDRIAADENSTGMRTRSKGIVKNDVVPDAVEKKRSGKFKKLKKGNTEVRTSPRLSKRESR